MSPLRLSMPLRLVAAIVVLIGTTAPVTAFASGSGPAKPTPSPTANQPGTPDLSQPLPAQSLPNTAAAPLVGAPGSAAGLNNGRLTKEVFGFATSGSLADPTIGYPSWDFNLLSTVSFFALHTQYNGLLVGDSNYWMWESSTFQGLVATAHAHGTKVVVTVVGPPYADQCDALYNSATTATELANEVMLKHADGVNIDYEGQLQLCPNNNPALDQTNQDLLTAFAKNMRAALDAIKPGYYLSIDTYSGSAAGTDGYFNIPDLAQYVDAFFVMAYDMDYANQSSPPVNCTGSQGLNCLSPVSPISSYYYNDTISMTQYSAIAGPGKVILGQPYYGRVACVASPVENAKPISQLTAVTYDGAEAVPASSDVKAGTFAVHRDTHEPSGLDRWDTWYDLVLGCWREMYWQDTFSYGARYNLVNQMKLRGVGFWTLNYGGGAPELWNTLRTYFVSCTSASVTPSPGTPQLSATPIQLTAGSGACVNPRYEFWLLPPGGSWSLVQRYSANAVYNWNTTGLPPGTYTFSVWARDANSPGINGVSPTTYDAFNTLPYQLTAAPCTAMSATASPPTTQPAGTTITISGSATGCPSPNYQFWIRPPGGAWTVAQAYSANANFAWHTTGSGLGSYTFSVWARDASSLGTGGVAPHTYDAFAGLPYSLTQPSCSGATASAAPAATGYLNSLTTITGSVATCPNPLYEFWIKYPNGTWTLAQAYSASPTLNWNTTGAPAGTYLISVWARDLGSPSSHDSFSTLPYSLTIAPCTGMSASANPPTSTSVATPVTLTGAATGCPNPRYEFWIKYPNGTWMLAQSYSPSASLNWSTTGLARGSYLISIWTRDVSSSATDDSFGTVSYTLT
jgi:spore germination protein YaaH